MPTVDEQIHESMRKLKAFSEQFKKLNKDESCSEVDSEGEPAYKEEERKIRQNKQQQMKRKKKKKKRKNN